MTIMYDENNRRVVAAHGSKVKYLGLAQAQSLAESAGLPSVVARAYREPGLEIPITRQPQTPRNARPFGLLL